jgi:molybdopterin synthase sulfur carrier subunit
MRILYFAWLREKIGAGAEEFLLPESVTTVHELAQVLSARGNGYAAAFADMGLIRCAVDQEFVSLDAQLGAAKEVAFFPPVTGG